MTISNRALKDLLYEQVARIGKAMASPKRLELLELLGQGEKSVEQLAKELSIEVKLASAHLKVLKEARLVATRKEGTFVFYRLAASDVASLYVAMRECATEHLLELKAALHDLAEAPDALASMDRRQLMAAARRGDVIVIDVRPLAEYTAAHLPFARSMPVNEIGKRLAELPKDKAVVAYCRGPFCLFADEAVRLLSARRYRAAKLSDGVAEWRAAGLPVETGAPR